MTKGEKRAPHHHGNLREALIDYALERADAGSLESLSLREASRAVGVSPGAAYRHFDDRDALLRAVARRGFDRLALAFEAALPLEGRPPTAEEAERRFIALGLAYVRFAQEHFALWRLMFGPYGLDPSDQPRDRPSTYDWLSKGLRDLAALGVIRTRDEAAQLLAWTAIHGLADLQRVEGLSDKATPERVERHCRLILRALGASGA